MDLERLSIFLAIVELGSMHAAARRVHLTQPALSRAVRALEDDLGVALFERRNRRMILTAAGRALVVEARRLLEDARHARLRVTRVDAQGGHDLRLGAVESVAIALLPAALAHLRRARPHLHLKVTTDRSAALLERLARGALDLAVVASSGPPPGVPSIAIAPYRLAFYGRRDLYPTLARVTSERELAAFPRVELATGDAPRSDDVDASWARVSSAASVKALVLAGFGVGDLLDFLLDADARRQLVRARVPHDPNCHLYLARSPFGPPPVAPDVEELLRRGLRRAMGAPARDAPGSSPGARGSSRRSRRPSGRTPRAAG